MCEDCEVIKGAAFFVLHFQGFCVTQDIMLKCGNNDYKACECYECPEKKKSKDHIQRKILTFHDENGEKIKTIDISDMKSYLNLYNYAEKFLDPSAKQKATSAEIYNDANLGRAICFFNEYGTPIFNMKYSGNFKLSSEDKVFVKKYLNLENLEDIDDNFEKPPCIYMINH
ncbi:hypothetical protein GF322_02335 [Candidatus Dependentiae bacterium]|nr:hypothetical protein [Candidatus Dependentiae bacterium]